MRQPVAARVLRDTRDRVFGDVDRKHLGATRRQREGEAAVVAERVEQASVGVERRGDTILALIEEQPRLLPAIQIDLVHDPAFAHVDGLGNGPVQHLDALFEPFEQADARIVPGEDASRMQQLGQLTGDVGQQPVDALRQRLDDQVVAVAIDDERGQAIGFAVDEPVCGRIDGQGLAELDRLGQSPRPQRRIG